MAREEGCDDNNTDSHDGCSGSCLIESSFSCEGTPSNCTFTTNATLSVDQMFMKTSVCNVLKIVFEPLPSSSVFDRTDVKWEGFVTTANTSMIALMDNTTSYASGKATMSYFLNATV